MKMMSGPASLLQWPPALCRRNFKSLRSALKALSALAPAASLVPSFRTPHQHHMYMTTEICLQSPNKSGSSTSSYFCEMFPLPKFPLHPLSPIHRTLLEYNLVAPAPLGTSSQHTPCTLLRTCLPSYWFISSTSQGLGLSVAWSHSAAKTRHLERALESGEV